MSLNDKRRVAVGLSGGVDSAMAAKILLDKGFDVLGLTMCIWDDSIPLKVSEKSGCFGPGEKEDVKAAESICKRLGIKHYAIDLHREYRENILSYFRNTYLEGKTPNPCLKCNQQMKFGFLISKARELGIQFEFFATGHYARIRYDADLHRYQLLRAIDKKKDQSYFLAFLQQEQMQNLLFPLGELTKQEIISKAIEAGFDDLAHKSESQDFFEGSSYEMLFDKDTFQQGDIIDYHGNRLGKHNGLIHYTIGQRKNLGISGLPEPYYVIRIDKESNTIVLGPQRLLYSNKLSAINLNWVSIAQPDTDLEATAKIRLAHEPAGCHVHILNESEAEIKFTEPQLSITPGQGVVIYQDDMVLAGGIIE